MPFDPNLPANHAPVVAAELRGQFTGLQASLQTNLQAKAYEDDCVGRLALTAQNPSAVAPLDVNTADVPALVAKLNELLAALQR